MEISASPATTKFPLWESNVNFERERERTTLVSKHPRARIEIAESDGAYNLQQRSSLGEGEKSINYVRPKNL